MCFPCIIARIYPATTAEITEQRCSVAEIASISLIPLSNRIQMDPAIFFISSTQRATGCSKIRFRIHGLHFGKARFHQPSPRLAKCFAQFHLRPKYYPMSRTFAYRRTSTFKTLSYNLYPSMIRCETLSSYTTSFISVYWILFLIGL